MTVHHGDCLDVMRAMIDEGVTVDSCVTDPPYHLTSIVKRFGGKNAAAVKVPEGGTGAYARASAGFMGKEWDGGDVAFRPETWALVYDLLKPGADLAAFSGTRTYHRMACAIEDAGFEIRDQLAWVYGSGFPKSHDVSKAIDKAAGADGERGEGASGKGAETVSAYAPGLNVNFAARPSYTPATPEALAWQGWGTALKPAWEPILACAKPVTVEQHFAIIVHELSNLFVEIDLWLNSPVPDAARRFTAIQAKSSEAASIVLDGAKIRSLASIGIAPSAVQSFTFKPLASLDSIRIKDASALSHVRQSGRPGNVQVPTTPLGGVAAILTELMAMSTSVMMGGMSGNIVSSWLSISEELLAGASTFTIETASRLTIALKILNCSLRENTIGGIGGLSPSWEPICLARKPLIGTVAENVLQHGTGAINVDGCRVEGAMDGVWGTSNKTTNPERMFNGSSDKSGYRTQPHAQGRWPANLIHDGSDEVLEVFPETGPSPAPYVRSADTLNKVYGKGKGSHSAGELTVSPADSGSAARFFYQAKASKDDRFDSKHPTVKPVALMRWLCRLITPPKGIVLDPFAGTGTTGIAALREGFDYTLIEREDEYHADIMRRLDAMHGTDGPLFTGEVA